VQQAKDLNDKQDNLFNRENEIKLRENHLNNLEGALGNIYKDLSKKEKFLKNKILEHNKFLDNLKSI